MKPTVVFDFDGVIHSYKSGWKGIDIIPDEPVEGIKEAIDQIRDHGYEIVIVSTRCADSNGMNAMKNWLEKYNIYSDRILVEKPPAVVYIDDRAICFDGDTKSLLSQIMNFVPWYMKGK